MIKKLDVNVMLWICFIFAMVASWTHVRWAFALLEPEGSFVPIVAATAVDAGLSALTYRVQLAKKAGESTRFVWFGVAFFSAISVFANWLHGFSILQQNETGFPNWVVGTLPFAFSVALPVLVVYLGEIVSTTADDVVKRNESLVKQMISRIKQLEMERNEFEMEVTQLKALPERTETSLERVWPKLNAKTKATIKLVSGEFKNMEQAAEYANVSKATVSRMKTSIVGGE